MAKIKIEYDKRAVEAFLKSDDIYKGLEEIAEKVKDEAKATASAAENGAGGTLDGYAAAGFKVYKHVGGSRAQARIESLADPEMFTRVQFYTQKRDGVAHLRAALYKFTKRG